MACYRDSYVRLHPWIGTNPNLYRIRLTRNLSGLSMAGILLAPNKQTELPSDPILAVIIVKPKPFYKSNSSQPTPRPDEILKGSWSQLQGQLVFLKTVYPQTRLGEVGLKAMHLIRNKKIVKQRDGDWRPQTLRKVSLQTELGWWRMADESPGW
jgi:hypothetical protein